jgi:hypothetical protein
MKSFKQHSNQMLGKSNSSAVVLQRIQMKQMHMMSMKMAEASNDQIQYHNSREQLHRLKNVPDVRVPMLDKERNLTGKVNEGKMAAAASDGSALSTAAGLGRTVSGGDIDFAVPLFLRKGMDPRIKMVQRWDVDSKEVKELIKEMPKLKDHLRTVKGVGSKEQTQLAKEWNETMAPTMMWMEGWTMRAMVLAPLGPDGWPLPDDDGEYEPVPDLGAPTRPIPDFPGIPGLVPNPEHKPNPGGKDPRWPYGPEWPHAPGFTKPDPTNPFNPDIQPNGSPPGKPNIGSDPDGTLYEYPPGSGQYWIWNNGRWERSPKDPGYGPNSPNTPSPPTNKPTRIPSPWKIEPWLPTNIPGYFPPSLYEPWTPAEKEHDTAASTVIIKEIKKVVADSKKIQVPDDMRDNKKVMLFLRDVALNLKDIIAITNKKSDDDYHGTQKNIKDDEPDDETKGVDISWYPFDTPIAGGVITITIPCPTCPGGDPIIIIINEDPGGPDSKKRFRWGDPGVIIDDDGYGPTILEPHYYNPEWGPYEPDVPGDPYDPRPGYGTQPPHYRRQPFVDRPYDSVKSMPDGMKGFKGFSKENKLVRKVGKDIAKLIKGGKKSDIDKLSLTSPDLNKTMIKGIGSAIKTGKSIKKGMILLQTTLQDNLGSDYNVKVNTGKRPPLSPAAAAGRQRAGSEGGPSKPPDDEALSGLKDWLNSAGQSTEQGWPGNHPGGYEPLPPDFPGNIPHDDDPTEIEWPAGSGAWWLFVPGIPGWVNINCPECNPIYNPELPPDIPDDPDDTEMELGINTDAKGGETIVIDLTREFPPEHAPWIKVTFYINILTGELEIIYTREDDQQYGKWWPGLGDEDEEGGPWEDNPGVSPFDPGGGDRPWGPPSTRPGFGPGGSGWPK